MRTHDFRGPFKYGQYGTETASTVAIGDIEREGAHAYRLLLLYTLWLLLYRLSRLVKVRIGHYVWICTDLFVSISGISAHTASRRFRNSFAICVQRLRDLLLYRHIQ